MEFRKQTYRDGDFRVTIKEDEDAALICFKSGEDYFLALSIQVRKKWEDGKEREYAFYYRNFDKQPNVAHVTRFIDKFLTDKEYRKEFFVEGEHWDGVVKEVLSNNTSVNRRCADAIKRLCARKENKLKFRDFADLKTYGTDGFSRMKMDKLKKLIGEESVAIIEAALPDNSAMQLSACRWIARGLPPHYAVRKVKTDAEIANNARR